MATKITGGFTAKGGHPVVVLPKFSTKGFALSRVTEVAKQIQNAAMLRVRNKQSKFAYERMGSRVVIQGGELIATDEDAAKILAGIFKEMKNGYILPIHGLQKLTVDTIKPKLRFGF